MQARIRELLFEAGCDLCALKVAYARSMFGRAYEQERSIYARSILSGWPRSPVGGGGAASAGSHLERRGTRQKGQMRR